MTNRLIHLLSAPNRSITTAAEMTDAATLTSSLPMRMVTMRRRGCASRRSMRSMRGLSSWRICSIWIRSRENRLVSELEKNADNPIRTTKAPSSSHNTKSTGKTLRRYMPRSQYRTTHASLPG